MAMMGFFSIANILCRTIILVIISISVVGHTAADARAFFVFGDSLVDNGNNNYLATTARADSPPYGIDYPTHTPTGRFSNGLNLPDLISEYFGLKSVLAYLDPNLKGDELLHGANFASAGVGILNDTGIQFVNIIRIYQQLEFFREYQERVRQVIGKEKTAKLINDSLLLITLGGNDFVNNYYLIPYSLRSQQYDISSYCTYLIAEYQKILMRLYELGGRRVIVTGTGPLGCVPAELAMRSNRGECAEDLQRAASTFNPKLSRMLLDLNRNIGRDVFIAANANQVHMDFISSPQAFGFETSKIACCGQGPYNGLGLCTIFSNLCPDRNKYVFWDSFHPTERANRLIVQMMMNSTIKYMNPMNLSTLRAMDSRN